MSRPGRVRAALVLLAAGVLLAGCRFERRPDLAAEEPVEGTLYAPGVQTGTPVEDSARATVVAVSEAFGLGDVSRVAQLTTRDAVLIDQEEAIRWTRTDAGSSLPRPLLGRDEGLGWRLAGSSFSLLSENTGLFSLLFQASVSGENVPWSAVETWILVRTDAGWRLRYLHRSRGLGRPQQIL